ncbi:phage major capsid protein [Kordiimonas aquimaris]|uniref:phage major capsid protein n=1 Tax=Kordiimonas aquimaris TaxID=707591 RepID=UPI0021D15BF8|nr:phage major capsid protein [Kordiimonas aquimaris]
MEMTDLKSAIEDYTDAAENGILGLKDRMDALETKFARPNGGGADAHASDALEHKHAFLDGFIARGDDSELKQIEAKGLSTASGGDGGFAVPHVIDTEIEKQLRDLSPLRSICKVKTIETSNYTRLLNVGGTGSDWVGEAGARSETATPSLQEITITPGEIYANAAATQRALDDMQFDAEAWLTEEVAEAFAAKEGDAFINGDGVNKPTGFLHTSVVGSIGKVTTTASGAFDGPDNLVDLVHALKARYRQGAKFVMNSATLAEVRKMKDGDGNFIWRPGLIEGQADMLLGYPVVEAEDMPDVATGAFAVAFGNFERGYTIVERTGTRVLRDPYSDKPNVLFYATKRVGGAVVNAEAIKLLEFAA